MEKVLNWLFDYPDLKVYQYEDAFKFSLDSILLAEFAEIKRDDTMILDLCTGNAVIPILLNFKFNKHVFGVELQEKIFSLAQNSLVLNHMEDKIHLILDDVLNIKNYFPGNNFDVILCNPPYFKYSASSHVNFNDLKKIARHEISITLEQIICEASFLLKDKGRFYIVHIPERIDELVCYAYKYGFAVKEMQFIHSKIDKKPIIVLVTLVKGGKFGVKVYPPICIQNLSSYQNIFRKVVTK